MRSVARNPFPIKKFADGFKPITIVEASYLNTGMCKFESLQKDESRTQSADSSKACSTPIVASR